MHPLLALVRPLNLLITFLSIVAASIISGGSVHSAWLVVVAGVVGALVAAGANAINDYFDVEIDRVNRPDRPLPSGTMTPGSALTVWGVTSCAGVLLSSLINPAALFIASSAVTLLYIYSRFLKTTPLAGNIVVASMTGMAFVFGGVAVGSPERSAMPAAFAFLVNLARELVKDIEDREGDARVGAATVPLKFGVRTASALVTGTLLLLIATTGYAYVTRLYDDTYLAVVMVTNLMLAYVAISVWRGSRPAHMKRLSLLLKLSMVTGLAAIYFGSVH
jgi:geranylgeranylglycerol-phosphate geranylgeranyltransferase